MTSSHAQWQPLGGGWSIVRSPQRAWDAGVQTMSPRKTDSGLDASEGTPQRPPLLTTQWCVSGHP